MFTLITKTINVCLFVFVEIIKIITLQARVNPHKSQNQITKVFSNGKYGSYVVGFLSSSYKLHLWNSKCFCLQQQLGYGSCTNVMVLSQYGIMSSRFNGGSRSFPPLNIKYWFDFPQISSNNPERLPTFQLRNFLICIHVTSQTRLIWRQRSLACGVSRRQRSCM